MQKTKNQRNPYVVLNKGQVSCIEMSHEIAIKTEDACSEIKQKILARLEIIEGHMNKVGIGSDSIAKDDFSDTIQEIKAEIPELSQKRRERLVEEYNLDERTSNIFTANKDLGEYFEKVISELRNWLKIIKPKTKISEGETNKLVKLASNYIITDLQCCQFPSLY